MIASCQDLPAGQITDVLQIRLTFRKVLSPAMITNKDESIPGEHCLYTVPPKPFLMIFPCPIIKLCRCFQDRLVMQMQVSNGI